MALGFVACNNSNDGKEVQKNVCPSEIVPFLSFKTLQERIDMTIELGEHSNYFFTYVDDENCVLIRAICINPGCFGNCDFCRLQPPQINVVIFSFRGLGRWNPTTRNCDGWRALCDFTWFPGFGYTIVDDNGYYVFVLDESLTFECIGYGGILEFDRDTGQFFFDLLLAERPPSNISRESLHFYIDGKILVGTEEFTGNDLIIQEGVHPFNPNLGTAGGYRIPLAIQ